MPDRRWVTLVTLAALATATTFSVGVARPPHEDASPWFFAAAGFFLVTIAAFFYLVVLDHRDIVRLKIACGNGGEFDATTLESHPRNPEEYPVGLVKLIRVENHSRRRAFRCQVQVSDLVPSPVQPPRFLRWHMTDIDVQETNIEGKDGRKGRPGYAHALVWRLYKSVSTPGKEVVNSLAPGDPEFEVTFIALCEPPSKEARIRVRITPGDGYPNVTVL